MKERLDYLDSLKGFGILLMIVGHIGAGDMIGKWISSFHMPLFYFVSGYLFTAHKYNFKGYFLRKIKTLIVPYIIFMAFHFIGYFVLLDYNKDDFVKRVFNTVFFQNSNSNRIPLCGAAWFLISLFFVSIFMHIIINRLDKKVANVVIAIVALFGTVSTRIIPFNLPFTLNSVFVGMGIFYIGYLMKNKLLIITDFLSKHNTILMILGIISVVFSLFSETINMRQGWYGVVPLTWWFIALSSIVFWFSIFKIQNNKNIFNLPNMVLQELGKNSIMYICLNELIIYIFRNYLSLENVIEKVICFVVIILICYLLNRSILNTKFSFVIGK